MEESLVVSPEDAALLGSTEGARRATGVGPSRGAAPVPVPRSPAPDPEVVPKPRRRTFTAEYKLRILREAEGCTKPGQLGALLRREGLYSSHLSVWGRLRDKGFLVAAGRAQIGRRGRKAKPTDSSAKRVAELERENRRLSEKLRKAEIIIEFQKKVQALLNLSDEEGKP